jgi:adenosylcobinamide-phosphate guanylyltransferase
MAGGGGTRLEAEVEKPLFEIDGTAMIDRVLAGLVESRIERVYAATSPATTATAAHVDVPCVETPGAGYVRDLEAALADDRLARPALTVAADLPLLAGDVVDRLLVAHEAGSLATVVPVALKGALGVSVEDSHATDDGLAPTGLNVVGGEPDRVHRSWDARLAVNVNRRSDAAVAETLSNSRKN